jgi:gliding motility-associated-like protein
LPLRYRWCEIRKTYYFQDKLTAQVPKKTIAHTFNRIRVLLLSIFTLFVCLDTVCLHAQLCPGSLGDPVVDINFDAGSGGMNYKPANGYTYSSLSCPIDGSYIITNSTTGCFGGTWFTVKADHTGNGGNFMLVNASVQPADFFLTTITDLCPNTNYEFAAWIMNVLTLRSGIRPNVTFTIELPDGTILQRYDTGDILQTDQPQWKQYGFYFSTPADNAVIVLRMRNNAPGGIGNDLALDDITFRPCGPTILSQIVNNSDTLHFCEDNRDTYALSSDASSAYTNPAFQWQQSPDSGKTWTDIPGATSPVYTRNSTPAPGIYLYRVAVTDQRFSGIRSCRIASNVLCIDVHAKPYVNAGADRVTVIGDTVHLSGSVSGEKPTYVWQPPDRLNDATILNPATSPVSDITYTLQGTSAFGCTNSNEVHIKVVKDVFVPSAFTPNHDGKNDHWHISYLDPLLNAEVTLYNRYGQVIYHTKGQVIDWDGNVNGEPQPSATYVYVIQFKNGRPPMKGTVTLIR